MKRTYLVQEEIGGYVFNPARSYFAIVLPDESVNLVTNPEVYDLNGFYSYNAISIALSSQFQRRGANSLKLTAPAGGKAYFLFPDALTQGQAYTFSVDILGPAVVKIYFGNASGEMLGGQKVIKAPNFWTRHSTTFHAVANTRSVVVESMDGRSVYLDGWQCERKPYATTFISGNLEGSCDLHVASKTAYGWFGAPHRSRSYRTLHAVDGGRPIPLSELGLEVVSFSGFGQTSREIQTTPWAFRDGSAYGGETVPLRTFTIGGWLTGNSVQDIMTKRGWLIDAFSGPRTLRVQLFDEERPVSEEASILCTYQSGLEGTHDSATRERVAINLTAWNPYVQLDGNHSISLPMAPNRDETGHITVVTADGFSRSLSFENETWFNYADRYLDAWQVRCMTQASDGSIFVGINNRLVRLSPSGSIVSSVQPSSNTVFIEDVVAAHGYIYFLERISIGASTALNLKRYNLTTGEITNPNNKMVRAIDTGWNPQGKLHHDPYNQRIYVYGQFDGVSYDGSQLYFQYEPAAAVRDLFCYDYRTETAYSPFSRHHTVSGEPYTPYIHALTTNKLGDVYIAGNFKVGQYAWQDPSDNNWKYIPGVDRPWGLARWSQDWRQWYGEPTVAMVHSGNTYDDFVDQGITTLTYDGDRIIWGSGRRNLRVWRLRNNQWVRDPFYTYCPPAVVIIHDITHPMVFQYDGVDFFKTGSEPVKIHDVVAGENNKLYFFGNFSYVINAKSHYLRLGDAGVQPPGPFYPLPITKGHPLLDSEPARGCATLDLTRRKLSGGPASAPTPAYTGVFFRSKFSNNSYLPIESPQLVEWVDGADITSLPQGSLMVAHKYGNTWQTPYVDFYVHGDHFRCRLEISGTVHIDRIEFPMSNRFLKINMDIIEDTVVFSFAPGRPWVRSLKSGELSYLSIGQDSWPEAGLVRGFNRVIVHAREVEQPYFPIAASAYLYWTPEYRSFDQIVAESQ